MRPAAITPSLSFFLLSITAHQIPFNLAPFYPPHLDSILLSNDTLSPEHDFLKRDGNCPANYNSCSTLAAADGGACCTSGSVCTLDHARNIACCATGATCTGTIGRTAATTTASGGVVVFGSTTTNAAATITGSASYVSNAFFPFPYIPTTYINSAACNSAYSTCQSNYALCTQDLTGGGFGVTVSAPEGGVTVAPAVANVGIASATSICSSLSAQACYGIQSSNCAQFGTATTTGGGFVVATNAAARPTMGCMAAAGVLAGVGLGIAGQIV